MGISTRGLWSLPMAGDQGHHHDHDHHDMEGDPAAHGTAQCIFCLEPADEDERIEKSPCMCVGSMSAIHKLCLKEDLMKNLRLTCSICRYPFKYETTMISHGFCHRAYMMIKQKKWHQYLFTIGPIIIIIMLALSLYTQLNNIPGEWSWLTYIGGAAFFVTTLAFGVLTNEQPVHTVRVVLLQPTEEELAAFRAAPDEVTRRRRAEPQMQSVAAAIRETRRKRKDESTKKLQIVSFDFPITLEMIAAQSAPKELRALVKRSQEVAQQLREAEEAAASGAPAQEEMAPSATDPLPAAVSSSTTSGPSAAPTSGGDAYKV